MDTNLIFEINWLAVLIASVGYFAIGAIWYAPLFGKSWVKNHNIDINDPEAKKGVAGLMITSFFIMFIICFGLAVMISRLDLSSAMSGIKLGFLTGICFSAASISITYLYLKKPFALHMIDGLYHLVGQIAASIILCVW